MVQHELNDWIVECTIWKRGGELYGMNVSLEGEYYFA